MSCSVHAIIPYLNTRNKYRNEELWRNPQQLRGMTSEVLGVGGGEMLMGRHREDVRCGGSTLQKKGAVGARVPRLLQVKQESTERQKTACADV